MEKDHVVVMVEPALPFEKLDALGQINEVFGPFTEEEANQWTKRAAHLINKRKWLIIPLSDPAVLNRLDPEIN